MVTRDVYLQPDAADPVLEDEAVLTIVRRFVPGAAAVTAVDESGGEARAYMVDGNIVLKTQRPHRLRPRTSLEKEVFFLERIAAETEVNAPRVLGYGQEEGIEFICMTRMAGVPVRSLRIEGDARGRLLFDLGRSLAQLHSMPQDELAASPLMPGDRDAAAFADRMAAVAGQAVEAFASEPASWTLPVTPEVLAKQLLGRLAPPSRLVALHSNPGPEHVFADSATGTLSGLIDFGDAYISHPALDLRPWRPADRELLLQGYAAEAPMDAASLEQWRVVLAIGDMSIAALRPNRRPAALEGLGNFLGTSPR